MSAIASTPIDAQAKNAPTSGRLFFLDFSAGRVLSANPDGFDLKYTSGVESVLSGAKSVGREAAVPSLQPRPGGVLKEHGMAVIRPHVRSVRRHFHA